MHKHRLTCKIPLLKMKFARILCRGLQRYSTYSMRNDKQHFSVEEKNTRASFNRGDVPPFHCLWYSLQDRDMWAAVKPAGGRGKHHILHTPPHLRWPFERGAATLSKAHMSHPDASPVSDAHFPPSWQTDIISCFLITLGWIRRSPGEDSILDTICSYNFWLSQCLLPLCARGMKLTGGAVPDWGFMYFTFDALSDLIGARWP